MATASGGFVAPGTDFDQFMGTVQAVGAQAILIANYGSGTPQEAADWVRYANVTKGYHDQYWEIGTISGALSKHADEVMASLPGLELAVEQVFRALSEVDKEGRATRRALRLAFRSSRCSRSHWRLYSGFL